MGSVEYSSETYFLNTNQNVWTSGPPLNVGRKGHGCGKIRANSQVGSIFSGIEKVRKLALKEFETC